MPSIAESIGRVLGDRYRLVTPLGTGASAHVYLAEDVNLHRKVAIKVLHPALAGDSSFLKRFRAEARAVAALNHPNILQVYDWGEKPGEPYLVVEYLAGGSLRQIYDSGNPLTPEQAVRVGLEAVAGLEYAHRRGLVHRDIKPANLLFDADGRLRIADFGLARALAEAAWTEPEGAMLGTARYAAPEQVEGFILDGKADVYALALVLYEGVTGTAPFVGDTTIATLMARVGTLLPEHDALGPLNEVLLWAAAPEPEERYDAAALRLRLQALAIALPEPEPLTLASAIPVEGRSDRDRTLSGWQRPTGTAGDEEGASVPAGFFLPLSAPPQSGADGSAEETTAAAMTAAATTAAATTVVTATTAPTETAAPAPTATTVATDAAASPPSDAGVPRRTHRRRWPWYTAIALVIVAALVAAGLVVASRDQLFTPSHALPSLVGKTVPAAMKATSSDHFTVRRVGEAYSTTVAKGLIISQHPSPGAGRHPVMAKQGTTISVFVSLGLPPEAIPTNLTQYSSCADATQALKVVHLVGVCPASAAQYSSAVPAGGILGTSPAKSAPYGSTVTIITSLGHAPVVIPSLAGSTYADAAAALTAAGFVPARNSEYNPSVPAGQVIGTSPDPSAGPAPFGSTVTVDVSLGPQPVTIPDLIGQSVSSAVSALEALGLVVTTYGPSGSGIVVYSSPSAGTSVLPGTSVTLDTI